MTGYKRPLLTDRGGSSRVASREAVRIPVTCQIGERDREEAFVIDIGPSGCKVKVVGMGVTKGAPVTLGFGEEAPVHGKLKWIRQASIGVEFDPPLDPELVERVSLIEAPDNVIPIKRFRFR